MTDIRGPRRTPSSSRFRVPVSGIFLVGFMGAGKTSVGRALAGHLGWNFIDLDDRVVAQEQHSIPEIFHQHGEAGFRQREHLALRSLVLELTADAPAVVALGGGAFVQSENYALLHARELPSIFLDCPVDELWRRCSTSGEPERPLRQNVSAFRNLYEQRRPHYLRSTARVDTAGKAIHQIVVEVLASLGPQPEPANHEVANAANKEKPE